MSSKSSLALLFTLVFVGGCANSSKVGLQTPVLHFDAGVGTCAIGLSLCATRCVNLGSDGSNCGTCGTACPAGQVCQSGACAVDNGGCPNGESHCNGACTDTQSDPANCGACNTICNPGQACQQGQCTTPSCPGTQTDCAGTCANLTSDGLNCGACGTACGQGETCTNGQCSTGGGGTTGTAGCGDTITCLNNCTAGDNMCQATCLNAASAKAQMLLGALQQCLVTACPNTNGGVCDQSAAGYSSTACDNCINTAANTGACATQATACTNDTGGGGGNCGRGQTMCGGTCTSTSTDPANCGACGNACAQGQTCSRGACSGGGGGTMTNCGDTIACLNNCAQGDQTCETACLDAATNTGATLLQALFTCLQTNCPDTNGGVCDSSARGYSATACNQCVATAQMPNGKCVSQVTACQNDQSGGGGGTCQGGQTSCNGTCVDLTSDSSNCGSCGTVCRAGRTCQASHCTLGGGGNMTGCSGTVTCLNNCNTTTCQNTCIANATVNGQNLLQTLFMCLDNACPSTPGDICDDTDPNYDPNVCDACYSSAQAAGGQCRTAWRNCSNDLP